MNISIDINLRASEDITNSILTLAAVFHNVVPIFDKNPKVIMPKEQANTQSKEVKVSIEEETPKEKAAPKEKVHASKEEIKEITLKEVQDTLFSLSKGGKREEVKALIKKFGVTKLTDIPKEKYEQLLKEADSIN